MIAMNQKLTTYKTLYWKVQIFRIYHGGFLHTTGVFRQEKYIKDKTEFYNITT